MLDYDDEEYHYITNKYGERIGDISSDETTKRILRDLIREVNDLREELDELKEKK